MSHIICTHCMTTVPHGATLCRGCKAEIEYGVSQGMCTVLSTSGTVCLEKVDYRQIPPRELRRKIGMVTQRAFLFPGTVYDNLSFGPRQHGEVLSEIRAEELLTRVGLPGYAARDVANLSGGEPEQSTGILGRPRYKDGTRGSSLWLGELTATAPLRILRRCSSCYRHQYQTCGRKLYAMQDAVRLVNGNERRQIFGISGEPDTASAPA